MEEAKGPAPGFDRARQRQTLRLLEEAIRRDIHFIARRPNALFQCLWNSCWWYDCPEAARHYTVDDAGGDPSIAPWQQHGPILSTLLESWRRDRERTAPTVPWLRSLRPPPEPLGTGARAVLLGHEGPIRSLAYAADGRTLASAGPDGIRVWDVTTSEQRFHHAGQVAELLIEPLVAARHAVTVRFAAGDASVVWAEARGAIRMLDAAGGEELSRVMCPNATGHIAISPDSHTMAVGFSDGVVRLLDLSNSTELVQISAHAGAVRGLAFSPDGQHLFTCGEDDIVRIWNLDTRRERMHFSVDKAHALAVSPDGCLVAATSGVAVKVRIWDIATGIEKGRVAKAAAPGGRLLLDATLDEWQALEFTPDGSCLVSGGGYWDRAVHMLDAETGRELRKFAGHYGAVTALACSRDGRHIASGSDDRSIVIWDRRRIEVPPLLRGSAPHGSQEWSLGLIVQLKFSPDGKQVLTGAYDHTSRLWDCATGEFLEHIFTPSRVHEILNPWVHMETELEKRHPFLREPVWRLVASGQESIVQDSRTNSPIAWFPAPLAHIATHPAGIAAGAREDQLILLTLEGGDFAEARADRQARLLKQLAELEGARGSWRAEDLAAALALLEDATHLFRQLEDTGAVSHPALDGLVLRKSDPAERCLALKMLFSMHDRAEVVFRHHRADDAMSASRAQRDLILNEYLDIQERMADHILKVGTADEAMERAFSLEARGEVESAIRLYERAERIYREIGDTESLKKTLEFRLHALRRQMQDSG